ncbi:NAMPT [Symbiodinium sp. CCMP2592]|nr:NAMPT [Symbiodinium sp. CCMP2592]
MAMSASAKAADAVSAGELERFFQFLQCQLRMEADHCMGQVLELQDHQARVIWPHFEAWVRPNLGKKEKWMPFHTVLGAHELFIVENIHHNAELQWDEKCRFLAMFVFRAHCRGTIFREAQLPHMRRNEFWKDPVSYFQQNGKITRSMLSYRKKTGQPLQTSAFLAIPERLCQDDDENLAQNVAQRTRTLLEVAEQLWPILRDDRLSSVEKFEQISRAIQAGYRLGETWAKMLMVSIDIAHPKEQLLANNCDVGVGALKALQRLFNGNCPLDLRCALRRATCAANESPGRSAQDFWGLLSQVEAMAKTHFAKLPLVLQQVSSQNQLSVVTMQVQLCEWRQFMDHLAKTGAAVLSSGLVAPEAQDDEEGPPAGSAQKYRRVMGKSQETTVPVRQTDTKIIRIRSSGQRCKSPSRTDLSDSEDDKPLLALGQTSRPVAKARQEAPLPALGMPEAAYIQQESASLRKETVRKDQAVKLLQAAQKEVDNANAMHQALMVQVREAMCRRSAFQEALNKAELEVTEHSELMQQSQWDLDCLSETLTQLGDNYASADGHGHLLDARKACADMPALAERLSVASSARQARMEHLFNAVQEDVEASHAAFEELQEKHAELTKKSDMAMSELRKAKDEVNQKMKALDAAKQTCIEARNAFVQRRVEHLTIEAQVVLLEKLVAG